MNKHMQNYYIGKCPKCQAVKACADDDGSVLTDWAIKDMLRAGLTVKRIQAETIELQRCECGEASQ